MQLPFSKGVATVEGDLQGQDAEDIPLATAVCLDCRFTVGKLSSP